MRARLHELAVAIVAVFSTFGAGQLLHSGILGLLVGIAVLVWGGGRERDAA